MGVVLEICVKTPGGSKRTYVTGNIMPPPIFRKRGPRPRTPERFRRYQTFTRPPVLWRGGEAVGKGCGVRFRLVGTRTVLY